MTEIRAEVGQVVGAGAPVVVVARDGDKEVAIAVPENEIGHFAVGDKLAARFWADDAIALTGTVREVSGSADSTSRTFAVRVSLPEDARIRLGMTATLSADVPVGNGGIVMPLAALAQRDGKPIVWVVDPAKQTVVPRNVATEAFAADGVRISRRARGRRPRGDGGHPVHDARQEGSRRRCDAPAAIRGDHCRPLNQPRHTPRT